MKHQPTSRDRVVAASLVATVDTDRCIGCGDCALVCRQGAFQVVIEREGTLPLELCVGCGLCETKCPMGAIKERKKAANDPGLCIGCGSCVHECPANALVLVSEDDT